MTLKVYTAGPDVFYPDSDLRGKILSETCRGLGAEALYPADAEVLAKIEAMKSRGEECMPSEIAEMIFVEDVKKIIASDVVIANLAAFRGPEADPGTSFEMGMAYG
ncbi:nucleoside 2-deoxyribosyltransferase [Acidocella facilis]|uniref:nucleoside 2-deoxyribosyltransferase n=1 Tax=Acidocella facilis TaxID=525 RepID=UPI001F2EBBC4|nr:nucleoside 2-deoxyribosyltransferase [Acidocella facilis]